MQEEPETKTDGQEIADQANDQADASKLNETETVSADNGEEVAPAPAQDGDGEADSDGE